MTPDVVTGCHLDDIAWISTIIREGGWGSTRGRVSSRLLQLWCGPPAVVSALGGGARSTVGCQPSRYGQASDTACSRDLQNEIPNPTCARGFPSSGHATSRSMMTAAAAQVDPPPKPRSNG